MPRPRPVRAGNGSIYTANTSATAVADYVEANRDASWEEAAGAVSTTSPTRSASAIRSASPRTRARVVLEPLSPDQPNVVDYADIAGTALIQFSPGPTPGVVEPAHHPGACGHDGGDRRAHRPAGRVLALHRVGPVRAHRRRHGDGGGGTHRRLDLRADASRHRGRRPAGRSGDRSERHPRRAGRCTRSSSPARSRAPPTAARSRCARSCRASTTSDLPDGTTFTVNYVATEPDETVVVRDARGPRRRHAGAGGEQFPIGTVVEFEEIAPESVPAGSGAARHRPRTRSRSARARPRSSCTNAATAQVGTFSVVEDSSKTCRAASGPPSQATVPVNWRRSVGGENRNGHARRARSTAPCRRRRGIPGRNPHRPHRRPDGHRPARRV